MSNDIDRKILEGLRSDTDDSHFALFYVKSVNGVFEIDIHAISLLQSDEEILRSMGCISSEKEFVFWARSNEGRKWFHDNETVLKEAFFIFS